MKSDKTIILLTISVLLISGCAKFNLSNSEIENVTYNVFAMDTFVNISVDTDKPKEADKAVQEVEEKISQLELMLSIHEPNSEISKLSKKAGVKPVEVSEETFYLLQKGKYFGEMTEGKFDITVAPLLEIYNWREKSVPCDDQLKEAKKMVDYTKLVLDEDNKTAFLKEQGMKVDLGGIAKGYIVDVAVEVLQDHGMESGFVDGGGDIRFIGEKYDGSPWRIGVSHPRNKDQRAGIVETFSQSIVTSGDYERYFIDEHDRRIHHIINPLIGVPSQKVQSVTIVAPNATIADTLSTALFMYKPEQGIKFIEGLTDIEALIIDKNGDIFKTEKMKDKFVNEVLQ